MSEYMYLAHHGIKGQKHGYRRWQNPDGSLTPAGRVHYGVGAARDKVGSVAKSVGKAIRKKVAPTNAELNAQIRKQKSKNLNKQKRRELRDLKRGIDSDASSSSQQKPLRGQNKRFSEMSDQDIQDRIKRLRSEIELAELERTKAMGPGTRLVYQALKDGGQQALKNIVAKGLTDAGMKAVGEMLSEKPSRSERAKEKDDDKKAAYESELALRKSKKELSDWKKENPEGLAKLSPSSRKAVKEAKEKKQQEKADEELRKEAARSQNKQTIYRELEVRAKGYKAAGLSNSQIAKKLGVSEGDVSYYLYEKPKKK